MKFFSKASLAGGATFLLVFAIGDKVNDYLQVDGIQMDELKSFLLITPIVIGGLGAYVVQKAPEGKRLLRFLGFLGLAALIPLGTMLLVGAIVS